MFPKSLLFVFNKTQLVVTLLPATLEFVTLCHVVVWVYTDYQYIF
jgi:hypothetical protein